jgi:hypothetical protein
LTPLNETERNSPGVVKLVEYLEQRIETMRSKNEAVGLSMEDTEGYRRTIAEFRKVRAFIHPAEPQKMGHSDPYFNPDN